MRQRERRFTAIATIIDEDSVTTETYQAAVTSMLVPFEVFDDEITVRTWISGIAGTFICLTAFEVSRPLLEYGFDRFPMVFGVVADRLERC